MQRITWGLWAYLSGMGGCLAGMIVEADHWTFWGLACLLPFLCVHPDRGKR